MSEAPTLDALNAMSAGELAAALSGPSEQRVALLRAAAAGGAVEAQLRLGQLLLDGQELPADPIGALRLFGAAARAGDPMGMNMVGRCLEHGWGSAVDPAGAADWYRAAAMRGLDWGRYNLATLLALGRGVAQDRAEALRLFRQAAARGHAKSITMVGSFHEDGWVVKQDLAEAARHYARGARAGDCRGQFNHARMLIAAGRIADAARWISRVPETATPRFVAQVRGWLEAHPEPQVRAVALALGSAYATASQ